MLYPVGQAARSGRSSGSVWRWDSPPGTDEGPEDRKVDGREVLTVGELARPTQEIASLAGDYGWVLRH